MNSGSSLPSITPPTHFFSDIHALGISTNVVVSWVLYLIFALWAIYTLIMIYHWVRYSYAPGTTLVTIIVHLVISFALIGFAFSGI